MTQTSSYGTEPKPIPFREYKYSRFMQLIHRIQYIFVYILMSKEDRKDVDFEDWVIWKHGKDMQ